MKTSRLTQGFTVLELMITIAIVGVLMSIILFKYGSFNNRLALSSASQELAIAIRQAQTYGINVKEVKVGGGKFNVAYGIYFKPDTNSGEYVIFADTLTANGLYDVGSGACGTATTECLEKITFRNGVSIRSSAGPNYGVCDGTACPPSGGAAIRAMHITFLRPNPDAIIKFNNGAGGGMIGAQAATGRVILVSPKDSSVISTIRVENTGQIYVQ